VVTLHAGESQGLLERARGGHGQEAGPARGPGQRSEDVATQVPACVPERGRRRREQLPGDHQAAGQAQAWAERGPQDLWGFMCQHKSSSLAVQGALELASRELQAAACGGEREAPLGRLRALVQALRGHAAEAAAHPVANFVLQRALELAPPALTEPLAEELVGRGVELARGCVSCRSLLRVLRHQLPVGGAAAAALAQELLSQAESLSRHQFGNYVVQEMLHSGSPEQRREILLALRRGGGRSLRRLAVSRHSSRVLEAAIAVAEPRQLDVVAEDLLHSEATTWALFGSEFGRHVAEALAKRLAAEHPRRAVFDSGRRRHRAARRW